jgi:glycosyltransferase involved in cell wall biosynthesis
MDAEELAVVGPHLHLRMLADVYGRSDEFDIIHAHTDVWTLPFAELADTPTVITMHGRLDVPLAQRSLSLYPGAALVSISEHQRLALAGYPVDWLATIPNGLDLGAYHRRARGPGSYLAFVGRLSPEKRPDIAVEIAARTGWPLRVAAKVDPVDRDYFEAQIAPLFDLHDVEFVGELGEDDKPAFYGDAAATLFPSDWPEPFGLVMIEALACGTPVIAFRGGSVAEIIQDGVTGFVVKSLDEAIEAVARLDAIDRQTCRMVFENRFTVERMAAQYLELYQYLVASQQPIAALSGPFPEPLSEPPCSTSYA